MAKLRVITSLAWQLAPAVGLAGELHVERLAAARAGVESLDNGRGLQAKQTNKQTKNK